MIGVNYPNSTTCTLHTHNYTCGDSTVHCNSAFNWYYVTNISATCCDDNVGISTEELKALTKVKQEFDKPDNIGVPFMMMAIPKTNKRLSQLRQRHTR